MPPTRDLSQIGRFGERKKEKFIEYMLDGMRPMLAAQAVNISWSTVKKHIQDDENFRNRVYEAEMTNNEKVEDALFQAAISQNVRAIEIWLERRDPDRWGSKKTITVEGNINRTNLDIQRQEIVITPELIGTPAFIRSISSLFQRLSADGSNGLGDGSIEGEVVARLPSPSDQRSADESVHYAEPTDYSDDPSETW